MTERFQYPFKDNFQRMVEPGKQGSLIGYGRTADVFTWENNQVLKLKSNPGLAEGRRISGR